MTRNVLFGFEDDSRPLLDDFEMVGKLGSCCFSLKSIFLPKRWRETGAGGQMQPGGGFHANS